MTNQVSNKTALLSSVSGLSVVIVWVSSEFFGVELPAEVAVATLGVVVALLSFLVPATSGRYVITEPLGDGQDPNDALTGETYDDPEPEEITDPSDPSYVAIGEVK